MAFLLANNWWAVALRGVCGILFGMIAFFMPAAAIAAFVILFGAYALLNGIFCLVAAVRGGRQQPRWGALLLEGVVGVIIGIYAFARPGITVIAMVIMVGAWAVVTGAFEIAAAIRLRKVITGEWLLGLSGALSIVFGILLWMAPVIGAVVLAWWIGAYALVVGVIQVVLGFRLRSWGRIEDSRAGQPLAA